MNRHLALRAPLLAVSLLCVAARTFALDAPKKSLRGLAVATEKGLPIPRLPPKDLKGGSGEPVYKVSFSLKVGTRLESGSYIVGDGAQSNYVAGGEEPWEFENKQGTGVDFKKRAVVINSLVTAAGAGRVAAEFQVEVSGPLTPDPASKLHMPAISTVQVQSSFHVALGKPIVLVEQPDRRFEITIERLEP